MYTVRFSEGTDKDWQRICESAVRDGYNVNVAMPQCVVVDDDALVVRNATEDECEENYLCGITEVEGLFGMLVNDDETPSMKLGSPEEYVPDEDEVDFDTLDDWAGLEEGFEGMPWDIKELDDDDGASEGKTIIVDDGGDFQIITDIEVVKIARTDVMLSVNLG